jgi:hypothetical protein
MASAQHVEQSRTVNKCMWPPVDVGSGPTKSTCRWLNRCVGLARWRGGNAGIDVA